MTARTCICGSTSRYLQTAAAGQKDCTDQKIHPLHTDQLIDVEQSQEYECNKIIGAMTSQLQPMCFNSSIGEE